MTSAIPSSKSPTLATIPCQAEKPPLVTVSSDAMGLTLSYLNASDLKNFARTCRPISQQLARHRFDVQQLWEWGTQSIDRDNDQSLNRLDLIGTMISLESQITPINLPRLLERVRSLSSFVGVDELSLLKYNLKTFHPKAIVELIKIVMRDTTEIKDILSEYARHHSPEVLHAILKELGDQKINIDIDNIDLMDILNLVDSYEIMKGENLLEDLTTPSSRPITEMPCFSYLLTDEIEKNIQCFDRENENVIYLCKLIHAYSNLDAQKAWEYLKKCFHSLPNSPNTPAYQSLAIPVLKLNIAAMNQLACFLAQTHKKRGASSDAQGILESVKASLGDMRKKFAPQSPLFLHQIDQTLEECLHKIIALESQLDPLKALCSFRSLIAPNCGYKAKGLLLQIIRSLAKQDLQKAREIYTENAPFQWKEFIQNYYRNFESYYRHLGEISLQNFSLHEGHDFLIEYVLTSIELENVNDDYLDALDRYRKDMTEMCHTHLSLSQLASPFLSQYISTTINYLLEQAGKMNVPGKKKSVERLVKTAFFLQTKIFQDSRWADFLLKFAPKAPLNAFISIIIQQIPERIKESVIVRTRNWNLWDFNNIDKYYYDKIRYLARLLFEQGNTLEGIQLLKKIKDEILEKDFLEVNCSEHLIDVLQLLAKYKVPEEEKKPLFELINSKLGELTRLQKIDLVNKNYNLGYLENLGLDTTTLQKDFHQAQTDIEEEIRQFERTPQSDDGTKKLNFLERKVLQSAKIPGASQFAEFFGMWHQEKNTTLKKNAEPQWLENLSRKESEIIANSINAKLEQQELNQALDIYEFIGDSQQQYEQLKVIIDHFYGHPTLRLADRLLLPMRISSLLFTPRETSDTKIVAFSLKFIEALIKWDMIGAARNQLPPLKKYLMTITPSLERCKALLTSSKIIRQIDIQEAGKTLDEAFDLLQSFKKNSSSLKKEELKQFAKQALSLVETSVQITPKKIEIYLSLLDENLKPKIALNVLLTIGKIFLMRIGPYKRHKEGTESSGEQLQKKPRFAIEQKESESE